MLNPDGTHATFNAVVNAQMGLLKPHPKRWIGLPVRRKELVSLSDFPKETHWLLAAGDSPQRTLFAVKLPLEQPVVEQRLRAATKWTSKNIDVKASVEDFGKENESLVLEIHNQTNETLRVSEADVTLHVRDCKTLAAMLSPDEIGGAVWSKTVALGWVRTPG